MPRKARTAQAPASAPKPPTAPAPLAAPTADDIRGVLDASQDSTATHKQLAKKLSAICERMGSKNFTAALVTLIQPLLLVSKKHRGVEKVFRFLRVFCLELQEEETITDLINVCLDFCRARDKTVRYRACEVTSHLMDTLPCEDEDDEEEEDPHRAALYNKVIETMKRCLMDSAVKVRSMSVNALYRLHEADDPEDDVLQVLMLAMAEDACPEVRRQVLKRVMVSPVTLPHILRMSRDVCTENRKLTYTIIKKSIAFTKFTIHQRVLLLRDGLADRDAGVRRAAQDMLCNGWLKALEPAHDPIKMLRLLDVESYSGGLGAVLDCLIDHSRSRGRVRAVKAEDAGADAPAAAAAAAAGPFRLDPADLTSEAVLFWHKLCVRLKAEGRDDELDEQLPTLTEFCDLILTLLWQQAGTASAEQSGIRVAQASDTNFVLTQLISMCTLFDLGDEAGRRKLLQVLLQLLHMFALAQPAQYVAPAMASLRYLFHDDKAEYHKTMVFAVARLRSAGNWTGDGQQPDAELDLAHVELHMEEQNRRRVQKQQRLQELRKAEEDAAEGPELLELQEEVKALETQLYSEEVVWMRSLHIVINFLEHLPRRQKGGIPEFIQRTILTATQQQSNPAVYELAIWALGLWCHVDLVVVPTHLPIFVGALTHAELFVKEKALHCLVDVLLVWGGPAIEEQAKKSARLSTHSDGFGVSQALFQSQATDATTQSQPSEAGPDVLTQVACAEECCVKDVLSVIMQLLAWGQLRVRHGELVQDQASQNDVTTGPRCLQSIACQGVAKLLSSNRWPHEPEKVLAQLLLNFYNPALILKSEGVTLYDDNSESDSDMDVDDAAGADASAVQSASESMRQCLTVFFPAYTFASPQRQAITLRAAQLTLRHLLHDSYCVLLDTLPRGCSPPDLARNAPPGAARHVKKVITHMLYLTDGRNLKAAGPPDADAAGADGARAADPLERQATHEAFLATYLVEVVADPRLQQKKGGWFRTILNGVRLSGRAGGKPLRQVHHLLGKVRALSGTGPALDAPSVAALGKLSDHVDQLQREAGAEAGDDEDTEAVVREALGARDRYVDAHGLQAAAGSQASARPPRERRGRDAEEGAASQGKQSQTSQRKARAPVKPERPETYETLAEEEARRQAELRQLADAPPAPAAVKAEPPPVPLGPLVSPTAAKKRSSSFIKPPPPAPPAKRRLTGDAEEKENRPQPPNVPPPPPGRPSPTSRRLS